MGCLLYLACLATSDIRKYLFSIISLMSVGLEDEHVGAMSSALTTTSIHYTSRLYSRCEFLNCHTEGKDELVFS